MSQSSFAIYVIVDIKQIFQSELYGLTIIPVGRIDLAAYNQKPRLDTT